MHDELHCTVNRSSVRQILHSVPCNAPLAPLRFISLLVMLTPPNTLELELKSVKKIRTQVFLHARMD